MFMVGGMLKCPTLTLKVVPNFAKCLNPTFIFWCNVHGWEYAEMPHPNPNPKSCSKCHKMPRYNFSFSGVICLVVSMLKIPHPNLKIQIFKCPPEIEIHKFPYQALNKRLKGGGVDCKMHLLTSSEMIFFCSIHV